MRSILGLITASLLSGTAFAADAPIYKSQRRGVAEAPTYTWDGGYIGGYIGVQQGKSNTAVDGWTDSQKNPVEYCYYDSCYKIPHTSVTSSTSYPGVSNNGNVIGLMFGGYGGYNKQVSGGVVLGIELDGGYSGARDNEVIYAVTSSHKMPWNFNLTGRAGFLPMQDTMLYLKAGLNVKEQQSTISGPSGTASESKTKAGWTAGLGVEHKINQRLSARVEGMYERVTDQTVCIPGACTTLNGGSWNAKAGLAWSFN